MLRKSYIKYAAIHIWHTDVCAFHKNFAIIPSSLSARSKLRDQKVLIPFRQNQTFNVARENFVNVAKTELFNVTKAEFFNVAKSEVFNVEKSGVFNIA